MTSTFYEVGHASMFELKYGVTEEQIAELLETPEEFMSRRHPEIRNVKWLEKPHWVLGPMTSFKHPTRPFGIYGAYTDGEG